MAPLYTSLLLAALFGEFLCAPQGRLDVETFDLANYDFDEDNNWDYTDLNNYGEVDYYQQLELEKLAEAPTTATSTVVKLLPEEPLQGVTLPMWPTWPTQAPVLPTLDFIGSELFGPDTKHGMPTCLLCVCLGTSVYCDDSELDSVPPLPKETTHFYARFNRIQRVKDSDFNKLNAIRRIDLTGNQISLLDNDAFRSLPALRELLLADNRLRGLPELPTTLMHIDVRNNQLETTGIHQEAFRDMPHLEFLHMSHNRLDYVPTPLPESLRVLHLQYNNIQSLQEDTFCRRHDLTYLRRPLEDIRLDGNPINLSLFAAAFTCLPRLPVGRLH